MRDLLPEDMARFREIESAFRQVCAGWGYQELRTPTVEHLHLFTSAAGTLSPQMLGRVYSFLDWDGWSGERVVLRPDSTIPVARAFSENAESGETWKRFYVQSVLRFASGDESREDWQCGIELIGGGQPAGDIEIIEIAYEVLSRLGLAPALYLSDPAIMRAVLTKAGYDPGQQMEQYDRLLDGNAGVLDEVAERIEGAGAALRAMLSLDGEGSAYVRNLQGTIEALVPELVQPLANLLNISEIMEALGKKHTVSPLLVRNFEYYTGPVFTMKAEGVTVVSGGRYDDLLGLVGERSVPACGFAIDMDAVATMLPSAAASTPRVLVRAAGDARPALAAAFAMANVLRQNGIEFQITDHEGTGGGIEAVAEADGYTLRLNGAAPVKFADAAEVVRALTTADD
jgi:histidyl-tRNA synthetase